VERERPASWVLDVYLYNSTSCFNNGIPSCKNNKEVIAKKFLLDSEGTDCRIKTKRNPGLLTFFHLFSVTKSKAINHQHLAIFHSMGRHL
jgi:hypothetical protein